MLRTKRDDGDDLVANYPLSEVVHARAKYEWIWRIAYLWLSAGQRSEFFIVSSPGATFLYIYLSCSRQEWFAAYLVLTHSSCSSHLLLPILQSYLQWHGMPLAGCECDGRIHVSCLLPIAWRLSCYSFAITFSALPQCALPAMRFLSLPCKTCGCVDASSPPHVSSFLSLSLFLFLPSLKTLRYRRVEDAIAMLQTNASNAAAKMEETAEDLSHLKDQITCVEVRREKK